MKHFLKLTDLNREEIISILEKAKDIKENPKEYSNVLNDKTLLMMFEKPSLRTRISFEVGMTQLGGHAIFYDLKDSVLGKKETVSDAAKTVSRYVNVVMARLFSQDMIEDLAKNSDVPVINGLTDMYHPCQILADLFTIKEKLGKIEGLKVAYIGDANNNVTHSFILASTILNFDLSIACPNEMKPNDIAVSHSNVQFNVTNNPNDAILDADVVVTDSWMSYQYTKQEEKDRIKILKPFQVTDELMRKAKPNAIFMHCLPALRGNEMTKDVIDGAQSVVFDEAENRLHTQKALLLFLLNGI
jgi:ornithine carbamoyltransferase